MHKDENGGRRLLSSALVLFVLRHSTAIVCFFQGTSAEQDARFYNKEKKLLKSLKFPPNIDTKVSSGSHDGYL